MKILIFFLFICMLVSCKFNFSASDEKSTVESKDSPVKIKIENSGESSGNKTPDLKWEFVNKGTAEFDTPITEVILYANDKKIFSMEEKLGFNSLDKEGYSNYKIPQTALVAAYGWWAGWGMILYVMQNANTLDVYKIHLEEGYMDDKGEQVTPEFEPEKIKSINLN
ncbi:MAG TPA: hypothetical protein PLG90_09065 [Ignavibacteria bacterium]|nr:hypothetical protein [Ignavibacteria bacterium]